MNKELMKALGFEKEMKMVEKGRCPFCGRKVCLSDFSDERSRREFKLSGLCPRCQREMFG
jgi:hypothetical protein